MQPLGLIAIICLVMIFLYVFFKLAIFALRVTVKLLFKISHKVHTTFFKVSKLSSHEPTHK